MGLESFSRHFPVTSSHFHDFKMGMPNKKHCKRDSKKGKKVCRILLIKKIAYSPIAIPFLTSYGLLLCVLKLVEVSGRAFTLLHPTPKHVQGFVLASKQATDYLLLTPLMPVKIIAEVVKLAIASIFGSHFNFSHPRRYSESVQLNYYKENADKRFYKCSFANSLTRQTKAEIREIEQVYESILETTPEKIEFLKDIIKLLKKLNLEKLVSKDLEDLRAFCKETGGEEIEFKTVQKTLAYNSLAASHDSVTSSGSSDYVSFDEDEFFGE